MLPCVCSVIDRRWCQNVLRTKKSGSWGDSGVCHWYCYDILTSSVFSYWTDTGQHEIYLFCITAKRTKKQWCQLCVCPPGSRARLPFFCPLFCRRNFQIKSTSEVHMGVWSLNRYQYLWRRKLRFVSHFCEHRTTWSIFESLSGEKKWRFTLFALNFYRMIVDNDTAQVNYYNAWKSRANNLIVSV